MSQCLFCRIAAHELPANIVREDDETIAFRDINPGAPLHVLIIPKRHIAAVSEMTAADEGMFGRLFSVAAEIARSEGVSDGGYRLVMNNGADAGQSVPHVHLHLLGGRALRWPPG